MTSLGIMYSQQNEFQLIKWLTVNIELGFSPPAPLFISFSEFYSLTNRNAKDLLGQWLDIFAAASQDPKRTSKTARIATKFPITLLVDILGIGGPGGTHPSQIVTTNTHTVWWNKYILFSPSSSLSLSFRFHYWHGIQIFRRLLNTPNKESILALDALIHHTWCQY